MIFISLSCSFALWWHFSIYSTRRVFFTHHYSLTAVRDNKQLQTPHLHTIPFLLPYLPFFPSGTHCHNVLLKFANTAHIWDISRLRKHSYVGFLLLFDWVTTVLDIQQLQDKGKYPTPLLDLQTFENVPTIFRIICCDLLNIPWSFLSALHCINMLIITATAAIIVIIVMVMIIFLRISITSLLSPTELLAQFCFMIFG